jgi:hypothetical protein
MSRRHLPIALAIVLALVLPARADAQPLGHGGTLKIRCSRCIRQVTVTQQTPAGPLTYWLRIPERGRLYSWQVGDWRRVRGHGRVTRSRLTIHNTGAPVHVRVRHRASRLPAPGRLSLNPPAPP